MPLVPCSKNDCHRECYMRDRRHRQFVAAGEVYVCGKCREKERKREWRAKHPKAKPYRLTKLDHILLAMVDMEAASGRASHDQSNIAHCAWCRNKKLFGMHNFRDLHPSDNSVIVNLLNLIRRGLVKRASPRMYAITEKGRERARLLMNQAGSQ